MEPLNTTTVEGELPRNIVCLESAIDRVDDETLEDTLSMALMNGYILTAIDDHEWLDTQYTMEKYTEAL